MSTASMRRWVRHAKLCIIAIVMVGASHAHAQSMSPSEVRAIAKEATIYGFPLVDSYRIQYS